MRVPAWGVPSRERYGQFPKVPSFTPVGEPVSSSLQGKLEAAVRGLDGHLWQDRQRGLCSLRRTASLAYAGPLATLRADSH
jgi:hypothetical protein